MTKKPREKALAAPSAPTCSPMRVVRLGATWLILVERYSLSSLRYSARDTTRSAKRSMLMRSMGDMSIPEGWGGVGGMKRREKGEGGDKERMEREGGGEEVGRKGRWKKRSKVRRRNVGGRRRGKGRNGRGKNRKGGMKVAQPG